MKFLASFLVLALVSSWASARSIDNFEQFKQVFKKSYASIEEENVRREVFYQSLNYVREHSDMASINQFSDLTTEEFKKTFMSAPVSLKNMTSYFISPCQLQLKANPPASKDLRAEKKLTPVKMQGSCGSCWVFSSIAAVEGSYMSKRNQKLSLSEQQVLDCSKGSCDGGNPVDALEYIKTSGVVSDSVLHYSGSKQSCPKLSGDVHKISDYCIIYPSSVDTMKKTLATIDSPLVAVMTIKNVAALQHYNGQGVITSDNGSESVGHGIAIVGYGTKNGVDYWMVKNSWSTNWGDQGYGYIERNKNLFNINDVALAAWV